MPRIPISRLVSLLFGRSAHGKERLHCHAPPLESVTKARHLRSPGPGISLRVNTGMNPWRGISRGCVSASARGHTPVCPICPRIPLALQQDRGQLWWLQVNAWVKVSKRVPQGSESRWCSHRQPLLQRQDCTTEIRWRGISCHPDLPTLAFWRRRGKKWGKKKKRQSAALQPWGTRRSDTAASGTNAKILVGLDWCDMNYFS